MDELSALLTELGDYRGMVQLYEDQILRGKDMTARAELARKVARMWEEQLTDPREAADAWRRVLRMKQNDPEATAGLERAKSNMLKKPEPGAEREAYAPPKLQTVPPAQPASKAPPKTEPPKNTEPAPAPATSSAPPPEPPFKTDALAASLRAALAPEPEGEGVPGSDREPAEERPPRPEGLFFRSSPEEVTVSAPGTQPEMARATRPADEQDLEAIEQTFAPGIGADEMLRTNEGAALDFLDSTLARPPKLSEPPPPSLNDTGENPVSPVEHAASENGESFEEEVIIADDLAEMLEPEDDGAPPTEASTEEAKSKRSIPPPIPRH
jgi:hypothetical protein